MLKAFLPHRITTKTIAENTNPRFGLAAAFLAVFLKKTNLLILKDLCKIAFLFIIAILL